MKLFMSMLIYGLSARSLCYAKKIIFGILTICFRLFFSHALTSNENPRKSTYSFIAFLLIVLPIVLIFPPFTWAAEVRAFVDKNQTTSEQPVNLTVTISGEEGDVDISSIKDFNVVSRGKSTNVQIINGRLFRQISRSYLLFPLGEGELTIPSLTVVSGGKTYQTKEIIIYVSKEAKHHESNDDIFVRANISEKNPYEGQQIIYHFKLYRSIRITNANLKRPEFDGFSATEVKDKKSYSTVISGRAYNVDEVSYLLVPLKPGELVIKPAVLSCDKILRGQNKRRSFFDPFGDDPFFFGDDPFFGQTKLKTKILRTCPVKVNVRPLPDYSNDVPFSGLIGKFNIYSKLEDEKIKTGDSATLSVTVEGTGNIMDASLPEINLPEGFKVYRDNPDEDIRIGEQGYFGKKTFRLAIVPVKEGTYKIEPLRFCYFDISTGKYKTVSTGPLSLAVGPSQEKSVFKVFKAETAEKELNFKKKKVEFTGHDILPLKEDPSIIKNQKDLSLRSYVIFLLIPVFFYLMVKGGTALTKKYDDPSSLMAQKADKALKRAQKMDIFSDGFLSLLYKALVSAVFSKAGTKGESLTYVEAEKILRFNGCSDETAKQAAELLKKIESARYSGTGSETDMRKRLFAETKKLVRSLS